MIFEMEIDTEEAVKPPTPRENGNDELLAKHLQGKKEEWDTLSAQKEPLRLLDLPVDILQAILGEFTETIDLTSLALTNSALHALVIPHIYSRFDIIWPDSNSASFENQMGVDALTYGLATVVMAHDVFGEAPYQQHCQHHCPRCGHQDQPAQQDLNKPRRVRRGNYFAQYTRKFSIGNGPAEWVKDYLITKEGGKMLGTLAALAVARMRNLEVFIWDMPTGVLRDVWLALASLATRDDGRECRLERVWVRWHDNQDQGPLASPPPSGVGTGLQASDLPSILASSATSLFQIPPYPRVQFPTFSILPPLKSLSVLDIDELPYAEEMSVLVERSLAKLQELRIGLASHAQHDQWARPAEDGAPVLPPPMPGLAGQSRRPGGILGILVHRFCPAFSHHRNHQLHLKPDSPKDVAEEDVDVAPHLERDKEDDSEDPIDASDMKQLGALMSAHGIKDDDPPTEPTSTVGRPPVTFDQPVVGRHDRSHSVGGNPFPDSRNKEEHATRKLQLEILEIERVFLSIAVLSKAIDWSRLKTLTLLGCRNHEQLWKALRNRFTPANRRRVVSASSSFRGVSKSVLGGIPQDGGSPAGRARASSSSSSSENYPLKLRRLHTDAVSPALIAFIRDTLAPDSLEWLFLQDNADYKSQMSIGAIYRGAIRRHRLSLTKLLVDSTLRSEDPDTPDTNWRRWVFTRELIDCVTGGGTGKKMKLRELSMSIDYKDWHYFLRRLPGAASLRSLHIPHLAEHVSGTVHAREVASQVLDIVALRSEIELCYLGVENQCFEISEYLSLPRRAGRHRRGEDVAAPTTTSSVSHHLDDEDDDNSDDLGDDHSSDFGALTETDDDDDDNDRTDEEASEGEGLEGSEPPKSTWRLIEVLFYDEKISIFKARHGKL
jgi:hypothetical protein